MYIYRRMQKLRWPKSFVGRILLVCFIGTHVPLIGLVVWALAKSNLTISIEVISVVLLGTIIGTGFTFVTLAGMLEPLLRSAKALQDYSDKHVLPLLPVQYEDEAGRLMAGVQQTLEHLDQELLTITRAAYTDGMTHTLNRRWLNEVGRPDFETAIEKGSDAALILIDIDRFKTINDVWGHAVGDQAIIAVCEGLRAATSGEDKVVRIGGDEFCIMSFEYAVDLELLTSSIHASIGRLVTSLPPDIELTISMGATALTKTDRSFMEVYRRADANLYEAKSHGRNRSVVR